MPGPNPFYREGSATWSAGVESAQMVTPGPSQLVAPGPQTGTATRGIMVGGAGNLVVTMADGTGPITLVIPATACGVFIPIAVTYVLAATTATGVVAFW